MKWWPNQQNGMNGPCWTNIILLPQITFIRIVSYSSVNIVPYRFFQMENKVNERVDFDLFQPKNDFMNLKKSYKCNEKSITNRLILIRSCSEQCRKNRNDEHMQLFSSQTVRRTFDLVFRIEKRQPQQLRMFNVHECPQLNDEDHTETRSKMKIYTAFWILFHQQWKINQLLEWCVFQYFQCFWQCSPQCRKYSSGLNVMKAVEIWCFGVFFGPFIRIIFNSYHPIEYQTSSVIVLAPNRTLSLFGWFDGLNSSSLCLLWIKILRFSQVGKWNMTPLVPRISNAMNTGRCAHIARQKSDT